MTDPWQVLGLPSDSDEAAIRKRYLELAREFSPEKSPERFAEIRAAYAALEDRDAVLHRRLFAPYGTDPLADLIEDVVRLEGRPRLTLAALAAALEPPADA